MSDSMQLLQVGAPGPEAAPQTAGGAPLPLLAGAHGQAKAAYDQITKALTRTIRVSGELDKLGDLGDMVTREDVIDAAGRLVARGEAPAEMAGVLADMPAQGGGDALAAWVAAHAARIDQMKIQFTQAQSAARHQMGVAALQHIAAHAMSPQSLAHAMRPGELGPAENQMTLGPSAAGGPLNAA